MKNTLGLIPKRAAAFPGGLMTKTGTPLGQPSWPAAIVTEDIMDG